MRPPAFQFYPDDFLGGTLHFTDAETGLYIRLLAVQWSAGSLPDDDVELASYGKGETPVHRVREKFQKGLDGRLRNERLEVERQKQAEFRVKQADNGRKGGRPRSKGLGLSGLSQTKAKKSSPSPSPSPSPLSDPDLLSPSPKFVRPGIETMKLQGQKIGLPDSESEACFHYYETNGWKVGRNPMKNWQSAMQNWKRNYDQRRTQTYKGSLNGSSRPLTGAEQRQVGIPETPGLGAAEIIRRRQQQKLAAAANGMAAPPIQPELGSARNAGNG